MKKLLFLLMIVLQIKASAQGGWHPNTYSLFTNNGVLTGNRTMDGGTTGIGITNKSLSLGTSSQPLQILDVYSYIGLGIRSGGGSNLGGLYIYDHDNSNYFQFSTPSDITNSYTLTVPSDTGAIGQVWRKTASSSFGWVTPIIGSIANTQVGVGNASNSIAGTSDFTYVSNQLILNKSGGSQFKLSSSGGNAAFEINGSGHLSIVPSASTKYISIGHNSTPSGWLDIYNEGTDDEVMLNLNHFGSMATNSMGKIQFELSSTNFGHIAFTKTSASSVGIDFFTAGSGAENGTAALRLGGTNTATFSGAMLGYVGSTSSPTLQGSGDANTGINIPGSDILEIVNGGVARMSFSPSGDITTTNAGIITLTATNGMNLTAVTGTGDIIVSASDNLNLVGVDTAIVGTANNKIVFKETPDITQFIANGSSKVLIDATGIGVGTGTDLPEAVFHGESSSNAWGLLRATNGAFNAGFIFENEGDDANSWLMYREAAGSFRFSHSPQQPVSTEQTYIDITPNDSTVTFGNDGMNIRLKAYASNTNTSDVMVGGCLKDFYADSNNVSTSETDIYRYNLPTRTLNKNGDKIVAKYGGTFNDFTATAAMKVKFAGTAILTTGAITLAAAGSFDIDVTIIRTSSSTARTIVTLRTGASTTPIYTEQTDIGSLNFTTSLQLGLSGESDGAGGGSNDITAKLGSIYWHPASVN